MLSIKTKGEKRKRRRRKYNEKDEEKNRSHLPNISHTYFSFFDFS